MYNSYYDRQPGQGQGPAGTGQGMGMGMGEGMGMGPGMGMGQGMGMGMGQGVGMGMGISSSDKLLMNDISRAIILEVQAYNYYQRLSPLLPNAQDRQVISSIQRDEAMHYHWFTMILRMMGGQLPQIPAGEVPTSFTAGVRTAIQRELEANAFYQDIAFRAESHMIHMHFLRASNDELRHAGLLQNMLV